MLRPSMIRVAAWVLLGAYASVWGFISLITVHDVARPARAGCHSRLPWFEGYEVEEAHWSWPPPLLHCVAIDTDKVQYGERYEFEGWGWDAVVFTVAVVGSPAVVAPLLVRRRQRGVRPPRGEDCAAAVAG